ncbi:MAG: hypothetical protein ACKVQR_11775 [Aquabacterium sp.]
MSTHPACRRRKVPAMAGGRDVAVPLRPASWRAVVARHAVDDRAVGRAIATLAGQPWGDHAARCSALDELVRAAQALRRRSGPDLTPFLDDILLAVRDEQQAVGSALQWLRTAAQQAAAQQPAGLPPRRTRRMSPAGLPGRRAGVAVGSC